MGSIFCCCKKRQNIDYQKDINIKLVPEEENYDIKYKREVLEMCISEDKRYKHFIDKIKSFNDNQINHLFNADNIYYIVKVGELIPEHNSKFMSLIDRIEDLNFIFQEWYTKPSMHKYIKKLFLSNKKVSDFMDKSSIERDDLMTEIFGNDMPIMDKIQLEIILQLTPEYRAKDLYEDFEKNNKDFYSLIELSLQNQNEISENYYAGLFANDENKKKINNAYLEKSDNIVESLIKKAVDCLKEKIPEKIRNSKTINKIALMIKNKFSESNKNTFGVEYQKIFDLANRFKNGNAISLLLKDIKDSYANPIGCLSTVAFSFINLYQSISSFYNSYVIYKGKKKEFAERLKMINNDFENHIKRIEYFNIYKTDNLIKAEELLILIGREVEQDRKKVINLSKEIEAEIAALKEDNKKNALSIAGAVIGTVGCAIGTVVTGGALGIFYGVGLVANAAATGINSAKHVKNKKDIKDFENLLKAANDQYKRIRDVIEELEKQYELIQSNYY